MLIPVPDKGYICLLPPIFVCLMSINLAESGVVGRAVTLGNVCKRNLPELACNIPHSLYSTACPAETGIQRRNGNDDNDDDDDDDDDDTTMTIISTSLIIVMVMLCH